MGIVERREFLKSLVSTTAIVATTGLLGWRLLASRTQEESLIERNLFAMGTVGKIKLGTTDKSLAMTAMDAACTRIHYLESKLTKFNSYSDIGQLNAHPDKPVYVSQDTIHVLKTGLALTPLTLHYFDMGMGNLLLRYDVDKGVPKVGKEHLSEQRVKSDSLLQFDNSHARLTRPDTMLDLGGIAKGYAVGQAMKVLLSYGIKHAAVDLGGDLSVYGGKAPGVPWEIGIDPRAKVAHPNRVIKLISGAVASSGDYIQHDHVINPLDLKPSTRYALSTVIGPKAEVADALATAAYNTPINRMDKLRKNFPNYKILIMQLAQQESLAL